MKNKLFSFQNGTAKGVLQNMFGSPDYWNLFTFYATSRSGYVEQNAFNFLTSNYWFAGSLEQPNNLSFCFKHFSVIAEGYEIKTSTQNIIEQSGIATKWGFSGSNDLKSNWINYQETAYNMSRGEILYVPWKYEIPFRCFQFTALKSYYYTNALDLASIDVYGYVVLDPHTCVKRFFNSISISFFISQSFTLSLQS